MITVVCALVLIALPPLAAEEKAGDGNGEPLLSEIAASIDTYRSKTVTLRLRLKHVDKIFEKITFYDKKNHDIEFDYSPRALKKKLAADFLNAHEGMFYSVTFVVQNVGNLGEIIAELKGFKPLVLETVPEKGD